MFNREHLGRERMMSVSSKFRGLADVLSLGIITTSPVLAVYKTVKATRSTPVDRSPYGPETPPAARQVPQKGVVSNIRFGPVEIAIVAMSTAIYTVLGIFAVGFTVVPGVTAFYMPEAFIMPATMWFGFWGALGAFFGTILFSPYSGFGYFYGIGFGLSDIVSALIAGIVLRKLNIDITLRDKRSLGFFVLFAALVGPLAEAITGSLLYVAIGWQTLRFAMTLGVAVWMFGDITAVAIIGVIIMRVLSGYIQRTPLYHRGFFKR